MPLGEGLIRIVGGALTEPTEADDHRYGLRDYAMTYSALFLMENSIVHDAPGLGNVPARVGTRLAFTDRTQSRGQYTDQALLEVRLKDINGAALKDEVVTFDLVGGDSSSSWTAATNADGIATVPARLLEKPGAYRLEVSYAGDADNHRPDAVSMPFTIDKESSIVRIARSGDTLAGRLYDADNNRSPINGWIVQFYAADGTSFGSDVTEGDGNVSIVIPEKYRGADQAFVVRFHGDEFFRNASTNVRPR